MTWLLDLHDVSRSFGPLVALHPLTVQLPPGCVGLLGPNGAGKSTLLKLLMGLLPPSGGHGTVMGEPLQRPGSREANWKLRQLIGFMPEAGSLVPGLSGVDYVALAGELYGMPRKQALRRAHEVLTSLDLEEARYRNVEDYSLGMKQRAKLAQALVHDPPVLLLDEPTSGLDPAGRATMLDLIRQLSTTFRKSVLLSTHLLADVQAVCEQVIFLHAGRCRGVSRVADVLSVHANRYLLQLRDASTALLHALRATGVSVGVNAPPTATWDITVPIGFDMLEIYRQCEAHGSTVQKLVPFLPSLEDFFLERVS